MRISDWSSDVCSSDLVDVAIRYSDGQYPGFSVQRLPDGPLSPVCSPELQKGEYPLRTPQDLQHHTLLHACWDDESDVWPTWRMWLARAGVGNVDPREGYHFQQGELPIQAAIRGKGVRSAERRVGRECVSTGRSRWSADH